MKYLMLCLFAFNLAFAGPKVIVTVPDMTCQMCVKSMKKNFKSAVKDSSKDVLVDLEKKTVTLELKAKISEDDIKERVKNAGYSVKKITWLK